MNSVTPEFLTQQLELADQLFYGRNSMIDPQDLPGRYGRVVRAVDQLLQAIDSEAVLGGGWAVWRHGFVARVTQDIDVILPADRIEEFLRVAAVSGFEVLQRVAGRWPKLLHKQTDIEVDVLPEGERPGTSSKPAPTVIPHPKEIGGRGAILRYIPLPALIELKLAAGRARDESDVIELIRANTGLIDSIRKHLSKVHTDYVHEFERLAQRARDEEET